MTPSIRYRPFSTVVALSWFGAAFHVQKLVEVKDIMDRFGYCKILQNHMLPYAKRNLARNWIFQQDNDPKHTSTHVKEFFTSKKIKVAKSEFRPKPDRTSMRRVR